MPDHLDGAFAIALSPDDNGEIVVGCRDLPGILTWGRDEAEALAMAADALAVAVAAAIDADRDVPLPTDPLPGEHVVPLPAALAAKLAVWRAFRASGISKAELARRMAIGETEARRILDPSHGTRIDKLDAAARALGSRLVIRAA